MSRSGKNLGKEKQKMSLQFHGEAKTWKSHWKREKEGKKASFGGKNL